MDNVELKSIMLNGLTSTISKMLIVSFFCIFSVFISLSSMAQTTNLVPKPSGESNIDSILPESCIFSGQFQQLKQVKGIPTPLSSSGILFFSCDKGLIWESQNPFLESLIYTKQQSHFRLVNNDNIVPLDSIQHHYLATFLLSMLSADTEKIKEQFTVSTNTESPEYFILTPKNEITKKGLDSIHIQNAHDSESKESRKLLITIRDNKQNDTRLIMYNLVNHTSDTQDQNCNITLRQAQSCTILNNPIAFQETDNNN